MVLGPQGPGRVGRRRFLQDTTGRPQGGPLSFVVCGPPRPCCTPCAGRLSALRTRRGSVRRRHPRVAAPPAGPGLGTRPVRCSAGAGARRCPGVARGRVRAGADGADAPRRRRRDRAPRRPGRVRPGSRRVSRRRRPGRRHAGRSHATRRAPAGGCSCSRTCVRQAKWRYGRNACSCRRGDRIWLQGWVSGPRAATRVAARRLDGAAQRGPDVELGADPVDDVGRELGHGRRARRGRRCARRRRSPRGRTRRPRATRARPRGRPRSAA